MSGFIRGTACPYKYHPKNDKTRIRYGTTRKIYVGNYPHYPSPRHTDLNTPYLFHRCYRNVLPSCGIRSDAGLFPCARRMGGLLDFLETAWKHLFNFSIDFFIENNIDEGIGARIGHFQHDHDDQISAFSLADWDDVSENVEQDPSGYESRADPQELKSETDFAGATALLAFLGDFVGYFCIAGSDVVEDHTVDDYDKNCGDGVQWNEDNFVAVVITDLIDVSVGEYAVV